MNIILSDWHFGTDSKQIFPGIGIKLYFEALTYPLGFLAVYQDLLKLEGHDAYTLSLLFFDPEVFNPSIAHGENDE